MIFNVRINCFDNSQDSVVFIYVGEYMIEAYLLGNQIVFSDLYLNII